MAIHISRYFRDGWPPKRSNRQTYPDVKDVAVGEIAVSLKQPYIREFDDYYLSRNLQNNKRNPWFEEFWQEYFKCSVNSTKESQYPPCTGTYLHT